MDFNKVDVIDMLEALKIRNVHKIAGNEVKFSCPFSGHSHGDEEPSACMNRGTTAFFCFGCGEKGNAISFLAKLANISPMSAARFLRERYEGGWVEPKSGSIRQELEARLAEFEHGPLQERAVFYDDSLMDEFHPLPGRAKAYMYGRGFDDELMLSWGFTWDPRSDRVAWPLRYHDGRLFGVKGRAIDDDRSPKYLVLGGDGYGFETCRQSRYVFGLDRCTHAGPLIVCEGEWNAIRLHAMGLNGCSLNTASLSDEQALIIRMHGSEVISFFDENPAGEKGTRELVDKLEPYMRVRIMRDLGGKDAIDMTEEEVLERINVTISSVEQRIIQCT